MTTTTPACGATAPAADTGGEPATVPAEVTGDSGANSFNLFTWAEYDDPEVLEAFGNIEITIYNSNEEAIQKLVTAGGNGGYDMMCPTGVYIPQLVGEDLLEPLDLSRITNFENLDPAYTNQALGSGQQVLGLQGLGLDRVDLRQDDRSPGRSRPGPTSSTWR